MAGRLIMSSKGADKMANRADPDQTVPSEEQSDLGLHCLLWLYARKTSVEMFDRIDSN